MLPQRGSVLRLLLAGLAAGACTEQTTPTAVPDGPNAALTAAAGPNNQKVKVKSMQLASNTLRIDGPAVSGQVSIGNSGVALFAVELVGEIVQGPTSRRALKAMVQCSPAPEDSGKLPTGTCDMTFTVSASNSAVGDGPGLVPGAATFILHVIQTSTTADVELANKSLLINLVATPSMTVTLSPTKLTIGGDAATATAVIQNPANSLQGVLLQGWIVQGQTRKAAGGTLVTCGSNVGVLPPGTCTMTVSASASNSAAGTGTLVAGAATFELDLIQSSGGSSTTYDVETVAIGLVLQNAPKIVGIKIPPSIVLGSFVSYEAYLQNDGPSVSTVVLQNYITQGTARRAAGGRTVQCGTGTTGELPTGSCTVVANAVADNSLSGTGTLVPGPATLEINLDQQSGGITTHFDQVLVSITLLAGPPTIVSVVPASNYVVLDKVGTYTDATVTIDNPGAAGSTYLVQGWISQGTARRAAGGTNVTCGGTSGLLPNGTCVQPTVIVADNVSSSGSGTLVPGPATFELELEYYDGTTTTILDTKSVPITLVANTPSIVSIDLSAPNVLIGESLEYTARLYNPTGQTITSAFIQGLLGQGTIQNYGAGGTDLTCAGQAELPPGVCTVTFTMATVTGVGNPGWQPGAATFTLELRSGSTLLDSKSVTVYLNIIQ